VLVPAADRHEDLPDQHARRHALGLAERAAHARLQPIRAGARKHLVDAQHVEGVHADAQVEGLLAGVLGHVLVGRHAGRLQRLGRHVLFLPTVVIRLF
jgi:hypothetical protein